MAFPSPPRRKRHTRLTQILPRRTNSGKIQSVEDVDVEYRPQRGLGKPPWPEPLSPSWLPGYWYHSAFRAGPPSPDQGHSVDADPRRQGRQSGYRRPARRDGESRFRPPQHQIGRRRAQDIVGQGAAGQWPLEGTARAGGLGECARPRIYGQGGGNQRALASRHQPGDGPLTAGVTQALAASALAAARARRGYRRCSTGSRPARRCPASGR
jgi:hypothetical protein